MLYRKIASRPSAYKNMKRLPLIYIRFTDRSKIDNYTLYIGFSKSQSSANVYNFEIQLEKMPLTLNTDIKLVCNCDNFKYQHQALLHKNNGLRVNKLLPKIAYKLPKKIKPLYICKHLEAALIKILKI
jgi:hypothetical protein